MKQHVDLIPDSPTGIWLDNTRLSTFDGACTLCGVQPSGKIRPVALAASNNEKISGRFAIVECPACAAHYLHSRLSHEDLGRCYGALGWASPISQQPIDSRSFKVLRKLWHSAAHRDPLDSLIEAGPILDCGCGAGVLLNNLRARGIKAYGIEFLEQSVAYCRSLGLSVRQADLDEFRPEPQSFRYIVLSHVLEHVAHPAELLERLSKGLMPGGSILVLVPNVNSALRYLFGANWNGWDAPYHLTHSSPRSLQTLAAKAGLQLMDWRTIGTSDELRRCLLRATNMNGRMLPLRVLTMPIFKLFGALGIGSHLLGRLSSAAEPKA